MASISDTSTEGPLWVPSPQRIEAAAMTAFMREAKRRHGLALAGYRDLHAWSVADPASFWDLVWDFCDVRGSKGRVRARGLDTMPGRDAMPGARFFPEAELNFAENLLRRGDDGEAIVFQGENGATERMSWRALAALVSRLQQAMHAAGVRRGDRVAAMMPNRPETVAIMLAAASIGAVFSSCSPDFGERGVLDRFGQIEPKLLFAIDGYWYAGKPIDCGDKIRGLAAALPTLARTVVVPYLREADPVASATTLEAFLAPFRAQSPAFERLAFDHPLYILFSSGTTGVPKCIVHGAGGTLIQHLKEHRLHCDIRPGDRVFYFTTCGWMMWNWLVSALASEATLILFDGSPFHPAPSALFDLAERERATLLGTSAKFIDAARKADIDPAASHDLGALRLVASTGSPLSADGFRFVYERVKADIHLASISGGTDIVSCFVLGDPTSPVFAGEIQAPGLGMAVDVWDEAGRPVRGEKGELVCVRAFPSMPIGFWNDRDGSRYEAAYFERFPGVWHHGDFAEWTAHGGLVIHGRSDATLNPGGVRIGTAEIYAQVEAVPEVLESLAIGQEWEGDVRIVLFVRLEEGARLDATLLSRIKAQIRAGASPRHVPAKIVQVADIPRTKSGKITEIAVRDTVAGREVRNKEALANPEALELFADLPELRT